VISPSPQLEPFRLHVAQAVLDDLDRRLAATRLPPATPDEPWRWGADLSYMRALLARWQAGFAWRDWEARLNSYPQYLAHIDRTDVHFLIERAPSPDALPIVLTHGWPGSVFELIDLVDPLAHPERHGGSAKDAFTVVLPSLPGFGFAPAPSSLLTPRDVASLWRRLMEDVLGFDRYVAHGGDTGATITSWMGFDRSSRLRAIHLNTAVLFAEWTLETQPPDQEEIAYLSSQQHRLSGEDAYQHVHAEKPATLGFALTDSPLGLAAWIAEKFHGWTAPGEATLNTIPVDHVLATVTSYWVGASQPIHWMYQSLRDLSGYRLPAGRRVDTPTGFCLFPKDIVVSPPRSWLERAYAVASLSVANTGGHFPGVESVKYLVDDIRNFFRAYR
jgi:microsomal epoxide hydrolase